MSSVDRKILVAANAAWNLVNFRAGLIRGLVAAGYEVVTVAPPDEYAPQLIELGCRYIPLSMDNKGTHPGHDLLFFLRLLRLLRQENPAIYLGYTIKLNIYGSLAAHALGIPVINTIEGLGTVFMQKTWLTYFVSWLYRMSLLRSSKIYFLNDEDMTLFIDNDLVPKPVADRLPGIGVDLDHFVPVPLPDNTPLRFLLIARMLWDKGVGEFVEAARMLRKQGLDADFCLLGFLDVQNPAAISRQQMDEWTAEGAIRYLGVSDNVAEEIALADCIVLPSYREGVPRTLLEAAAMARPIVATDAIGCRDVVDDGINGYLCKLRDAADLADKIARMATLSHAEREAMGRRGRKKMEREFDEQIVINKYLQAIEEILNRPESSPSG